MLCNAKYRRETLTNHVYSYLRGFEENFYINKPASQRINVLIHV